MGLLPFGSVTPPATFTGLGKVRQTVYNVLDYGVKGDTNTVSDGAITSGLAVLTSATAGFTAADVGKTINVFGAGAAGATLSTTIVGFTNSTTVTLTATASSTVTNKKVVYGTDDTTVLNNVLAKASNNPCTVLMPRGKTFFISLPLVMYSNTQLDARGATIIESSGSNCNMLNNLGFTATKDVSDGHTTNTSTTITSATIGFTQADVGASISMNGADTGSTKLVTKIVSVTNATTAVVAQAAGNTNSASRFRIYYRDTDIEAMGGFWDQQDNGDTSHLYGNGLNFRHLDRLYVHDLIHSGTKCKNSVSPGDVYNYTIKNITVLIPGGGVGVVDGVHTVGPATFGRIENIHGTTGDDFVALIPTDYSQFDDTAGSISDIDISGVFPDNAMAAIKIIGGTGKKVRDVRISGVHGNCYRSAVAIWDDTTGPCDIDGVVIEDVNVVNGNGFPLVEIKCSAGKNITFRDFSYRTALDSQDIFLLDGSYNLNSIVIDGLVIEAGTNLNIVNASTAGTVNSLSISHLRILNSSVTTKGVLVPSTATINRVTFDKVDGIMANNSNALLDDSGHVTFASFNNINLKSGGQLINLQSTADALAVVANNIILDSAYQIANVSAALTMSLTNAYVNPTQSQLFNLVGAGASLEVRGRGLINPNNITAFTRDGSQTVRLVHAEMQADSATVAHNNGDTFQNTNASAATGVGVVQLTTGLTDNNGNAALKLTATGSAVNQVTLANAATGNNPQFSATGTDSNVGILYVTKGTGRHLFQPGSDAVNAFSVRTAAGTTSVVNVDTVSNRVGIGANIGPNSILQVGGPIATAYVTKSGNYTLTGTDSTVVASGSGTTITLPTAVGITGRRYIVKRVDTTNTITVNTTSAQTIDGASSVSLSSNFMAVEVQSDGANWQVIGEVSTTIL